MRRPTAQGNSDAGAPQDPAGRPAPEPPPAPPERPATATVLNERERTSVGVSDTIEPPPPPPAKSEDG